MVQWQGQKKGGTPPVIPCQGLVLSTLLSRRGRGTPPPHLLSGVSLQQDQGNAAACLGHPELVPG